MFFLYVQSVLIYTQDICSTIFPYHVEPVNTMMSGNGMQDLNTVTEGRNRQEFFETVALAIFKCVAQLTPQNK